MRRGGRRIERVEPFGWQVADARSEPVAENGTCGKDVIGEAARVGELLADMASSIVHQQAIEDVRRFACRAGITWVERRILVGDVAIGFQARIAIFRADQSSWPHLALASDEELSVARSRRAHAPEPGHG